MREAAVCCKGRGSAQTLRVNSEQACKESRTKTYLYALIVPPFLRSLDLYPRRAVFYGSLGETRSRVLKKKKDTLNFQIKGILGLTYLEVGQFLL